MKMKEDDDFMDDLLVFAFVVRSSPQDIQSLKAFLDSSSLNVVYRTTSYGPLYITREAPADGEDKE